MASENRALVDEKRNLETRLNHADSELNVCEMTKEHLRNDKTIVSIQNSTVAIKLPFFFIKVFRRYHKHITFPAVIIF